MEWEINGTDCCTSEAILQISLIRKVKTTELGFNWILICKEE